MHLSCAYDDDSRSECILIDYGNFMDPKTNKLDLLSW